MKSSAFAVAVVVGTLPLVPTALAQIPANGPVGGWARSAVAQASAGGPWCSIEDGSVTMQASDGSHATLSLPEVTYFDGHTYYLLDDQTRLVFTTSNSGTIEFKQAEKYPVSVQRLIFVNYDEQINITSQQYQISFLIDFPNCTLPIVIEYKE